MGKGIASSQADYQYALEGVSYAQQILKNHKNTLDDIIRELNNPEVMGGETGKDYCKRLQEAVNVIEAVLQRFNAFANKVAEVCHDNGAYVDSTMMQDFDAVQRMFAAKAEEISQFNGTKKA